MTASRRWFQEAQEDIKVAEFNQETHPHASAYFIRMVSYLALLMYHNSWLFQCIERSVKAAELTFRPTFTMTHEVSVILRSLPVEIGPKLQCLWDEVPDCLRIYSHIMYKGLNGNTG